jgi:hypothetical protein
MSADHVIEFRPLATNQNDALFVEFQAHILRKICEAFSGRRSAETESPPASDEAVA